MESGKPVLVTTKHRGVFFGYLENRNGETVGLSKARNCVYWDVSTKGFLGLASEGPGCDCRIGPPADIELFGVTSIAKVTPSAVEKWESAPWSS